ncbi:MAG TPA: prephenate dehydrogenase/arogenate dehydrogenase family protein [Thermoanaerobaculia bacterium]|nr:prephenate dehydrogenase/arogenate dehydrogenase family protein [Thermoanaerobaculia bacterium]
MSRAAVVGLGLIGGSVALGAGARGYDREDGVREHARRRGIDAVDSLAEAVAGADLVVTAVPTDETPALLRAVAALAPGAVLTDCASLKRAVAAAAHTLDAGVRFVASHPMAGGRGHGLEAASGGLFRGRPWAIVPTARSDDGAIAAVRAFCISLGARPVLLDAEQHDHVMTWASHLPQAVASALARAAGTGGGASLPDLAGPGLLDATRLAGQPVSLALELALADPDALARAIDAVSRELTGVSSALRRGDAGALRALFEDAAAARRTFER